MDEPANYPNLSVKSGARGRADVSDSSNAFHPETDGQTERVNAGVEQSSGLGTSVSASLGKKQDFSLSMFCCLLLRFFVHDNIAFRKVDSEHFKAMLTYLEGRLERYIRSRFSARR